METRVGMMDKVEEALDQIPQRPTSPLPQEAVKDHDNDKKEGWGGWG